MEYHALHTGKIGRNDTCKTMKSHVLYTGKTIDADMSGCLVQLKKNQSAAAVPAAAIAPIDDEHTRGHLHLRRETTPSTTSTSSQVLHLSPGSQGVQAQQVRTTLHTTPLPGDSINVFQTTEEARRYTYATVEVLRERFLRGRHERDRDDRHRGRGGGGGGGRGNVRGGGDRRSFRPRPRTSSYRTWSRP
jgi:hypothetical protein